MSRKLDKDLPPQRDEREHHYTSNREATREAQSLLDRILAETDVRGERVNRLQQDLDDLIATGVDGQQFLDLALSRFRSMPLTQQRRAHDTISPLVQNLYQAGANHLFVDYRHFPIMVITGENLAGIPDRPLHVTYALQESKGPLIGSIGARSKDAWIELQGKINSVGYKARDSSFILHGECTGLGHNAKDCAFYLQWADSDHEFLKQSFPPQRYHFYADKKETTRFSRIPLDFFESGNTLHVPDGTGGWQEVRPE